MRPRHQINVWPQTRPFRTQPQQARIEQHIYRRSRAESAFDPLRTGLLALKRGMTAIYDPETGKRTPCTVLQVDRNEVVAHKTREKNGYWAVQIGAGQKEPRNVTRPLLGHFAQAGVSPKRHLAEFKVKDGAGLGLSVGESVGANWFAAGQWVDVRGISRGMGFAGVSQAAVHRLVQRSGL